MDTYEVTIERFQPKLKHKVVGVLLFACVFFAVRFSWSILLPSPSERSRSLGSLAIEIGIVSLVWALGITFITPIWKRLSRWDIKLNYKLLVDADSITAVFPSWRNRPSRRIVRKGKVRSIFEIRSSFSSQGGIGISERGELAARIFGFVYVPKALPEFDKVKTLAESWCISD